MMRPVRDRVVIVPRWAGTAASDWYPWLIEELDPKRAKVEIVELPEPNAPKISACVAALREALGEELAALGDALLVGHSVGCQALLRYLAELGREHEAEAGVGPKLLCVAGWWRVDEPWPTIRPWIDTPIDDAALRRATAAGVQVLLSDNDPFTADWQTNAEAWRERLGAEVRVVSGAKHFNGAREPEVLAEIRRLSAGASSS